MKKMIALLMTLALMLCAVCACAEEAQGFSFDEIADMDWSFSSGAGGWSTDMQIAADGTFSGSFHDSEMGEIGDDYPNGSLYTCSFTGQLSVVEQVDEYSWKLKVDSLAVQDEPNVETIEDGIRYVTADPYGISEGDEMTLYMPGTPVDMLTEDMQMWAHLIWEDPKPTELEDWFLYSPANDSGFVGYAPYEDTGDDVGIANPWVDMAEDELWQTAGLSLNLPEGAEATAFRWMAEESLAEMDFTLDGDEYCARVKPSSLEAGVSTTTRGS